MKERVTISIEDSLLKKIDMQVDGKKIRNRSHAIEQLLSEVLENKGYKKALILAGGKGTRLRPFIEF